MPKPHDDPKKHDDSKVHDELRGRSGPKERDLATHLTIAVVGAASFPKDDPMAVAEATADIYHRMLALIGPPRPR